MNRRSALTLGAAFVAHPALASPATVALTGRLQQGGYAIGRDRPHASIYVDDEFIGPASRSGVFVIGFDRDEPAARRLRVESRRRVIEQNIEIQSGVFDEQRIDGLPPSQVAPTEPALLERIRREAELKGYAFRSREDDDGFRNGFDWPLQGFVVTGRFGNRRILNGQPSRPHYGIDLAAPTGTPVTAPASGRIVLAEPNLHFEGGLVLIDHGQGLVSMYLHLDEVVARIGDAVERGELIGRVGAKGRATGPHLCWRMKWRDRNLDPSLWVRTEA